MFTELFETAKNIYSIYSVLSCLIFFTLNIYRERLNILNAKLFLVSVITFGLFVMYSHQEFISYLFNLYDWTFFGIIAISRMPLERKILSFILGLLTYLTYLHDPRFLLLVYTYTMIVKQVTFFAKFM